MVVNARIRLRYDTYENWTLINPIIKKGEMALVANPPGFASDPPVLFKVGTNDVMHFNEIPWGSAQAADVYEWAKQMVKPTYDYSEIENAPIIMYKTTAEWDSQPSFMSVSGGIYIYSDKDTITIAGETINIPGIKIGHDGYPLIDLGFVTTKLEQELEEHILNGSIHVSDADREYWDNKISCVDETDILWENEILQLYR